jgi:acetyl esterase/lipase
VADELSSALDAFPALVLTPKVLPLIRQGHLDAFARRPSAEMPDVQVAEIHIAGPSGEPDIRILEYRPAVPAGVSLPAALHLHGGGHILGLPEMSDLRNALLVRELGCVIVSADYRLAPEHPFPAGLEDAYAALKWLYDGAEARGIDPQRIVVIGESAGGGMAAGLALMARDRGEIPILGQLLIYPMLDDRSSTSENPVTGEFIWTREHNAFGWESLLRTHSGPIPAYAAPSHAEDLAGLPQTYVGVGALDLFLDEDIQYACRLIRTGVAVTLEVVPSAFHGFASMSQGPLSAGFFQSHITWLARVWSQ